MAEQKEFLDILPDLIGTALFLIGVSTMLFLQVSNNAALKRQVFRWSLAVMAPLAVGFFWAARAPLPIVLAFIPGVAFIVFMNLRNVRFCDACGKTLVNYNLIFRHKFCSNCGSKLD